MAAAVAIALAIAGCSPSPQTFTLNVTVQAPFDPVVIAGSDVEEHPIGSTCQGGFDDSRADLSHATLYVQDEHGKTLQSQVLTSGKVERYADIFRSCSIKVRVTDVPATGKKYRVKVGKSTSALVSPSKAIKGFGFNVNP